MTDEDASTPDPDSDHPDPTGDSVASPKVTSPDFTSPGFDGPDIPAGSELGEREKEIRRHAEREAESVSRSSEEDGREHDVTRTPDQQQEDNSA